MGTKIIAITNQKGGVAKTTTAINLSASLAFLGNNVLSIDLDPQGNLSSGLGLSQSDRKVTIYNVLIGTNALEEAIVQSKVDNLCFIPSNSHLAAINVEFLSYQNKEFVLSNLLKHSDYDYIIIDCPPALDILTINALVAANNVLIPMQCDFYSLEGLSHLLKTIEIVEKTVNPLIKIMGILFTMYDCRSNLTKYVENDVRSYLGNLIFNTVIPRNIKLAEAPSHGMPIVLYDAKCSGAIGYLALAKEVLLKSRNKII